MSVRGIEPRHHAWKACILPLYYTDLPTTQSYIIISLSIYVFFQKKSIGKKTFAKFIANLTRGIESSQNFPEKKCSLKSKSQPKWFKRVVVHVLPQASPLLPSTG